MHTRLVRPRPVQLFVAGAVLALGIAGACSAGAPDAPDAHHAPAAQGRIVELPASTPPVAAQGVPEPKQIPGTGMLRYPDAMRAARREGEVYTMFVIDEHGLVDTSSLRVLKSTDTAFTSAVRSALPTMRFEPARKDGRAVRQVVQQPFTFALPRNSDGEPRREVGERDR